MEDQTPDDQQRRSRWEMPQDSDLVGIPLAIGAIVAVLAIIAGFAFLGWFGLIVLVVVLFLALWVSYRAITASDNPGN